MTGSNGGEVPPAGNGRTGKESWKAMAPGDGGTATGRAGGRRYGRLEKWAAETFLERGPAVSGLRGQKGGANGACARKRRAKFAKKM